MKHKKLIGILATSALLLGSVATFAACGGKEHKIERVDETQATCTEGGHAAYYKCTDEGCDKIFSDIEGKHEIKWDDVNKTDPLGHSMTHVEAKAADCTEDGANEHYHCNRCENDFADEAGATPMEDAVIDALGHDMKPVQKVLPVTGSPGVKAHYRCDRENVEYFDSFGDKKVTDENRHELEYDMLTTAPSGWYDVHHDFSHTNDADPYVTITGENGLNVATNEYYTDIAYTARVQKANVNRQFIVLFFENQAIYSVSVDNGKIKCDSEMSGWGYGTDQGYSYLNDEWEYTLSAGEQDCYEGNGLEVTLARTGKTVKVFVNGQEVHSATLADEYEATLAKGGMLVWNAVPSVKYYFRAEAQAKAPEAPKVTVDCDSAQGSVTLNKETFAYGDELVVTVTPTEDYVFNTLFVNGREITKLTDGTYTTTATNIINISVVFKAREYGSVNATVTGKKHGVTGNSIAENAAFELVGKNQTYSGSLSNGKLNVNKVLTGEYTLKIEGYLDQTITIEKDVEYTTAIVFEYDMFSMLHTNNGDEGYWNLTGTKNDFTHQNDTNVLNVLNGSDGMWVAYTNDKYDDLYFSATFKEGQSWDNRKAIQLVFDNGTGIQFGLKQDGAGISFGYWYSDRYLLNRGDEARLAPEEKIGNLSAEQLTKFNGNGITVSVVRKANKIMLLVDGNTVRVLALSADYATKKCTPAIIIEWAGEQEIGVSVSTALPAFETPTFKLTQGQNGTVTKTSGDTYSVWEKITLEITPNSNYRLKQLTVNGVVITGNKTEYSFYPVAGENTVVAEFEQIPYGSVNAEITGKKNGVTGNSITDGTKVDLIGADSVEYKNLTVTGGKIAVAEVVAGTYTVKVAGYLDGSITVTEGAAYEIEIALEYDMFTTYGWYDAHQDFSHQNDADGYVTIKGSDGLNFVTKNEYDQVAITLTVGKDICAGERTGVMMTFGNKMLWFTVKKTNESITFEWLGDGNWDTQTIVPEIWGFDGNALTEAELESWNNNTMQVTLVRNGKDYYAFVNGTCRTSLTLNDYATQKTQAGVRAWGAVVGRQYSVSVEEDITEYLNKLPTE